MWYSSNYANRAAIACDGSALASGAKDIKITIPSGWTDFWSNVLSNGFDVIFVANAGTSTLTFERESWDKAAQNGNFNIDGVAFNDNTVRLIWMYWNYPAASADIASTFVETDDVIGYISLDDPTKSASLVVARPESPGAVRPLVNLAKTSSDDLYVWWDVTAYLATATGAVNGRLQFEELQDVVCPTASVGGTDAYTGASTNASLVTSSYTRFVETSQRLFIGTNFDNGTIGTDYSLRLIWNSSVPDGGVAFRTLEHDSRALMQVRNPSE